MIWINMNVLLIQKFVDYFRVIILGILVLQCGHILTSLVGNMRSIQLIIQLIN